MPTQKLKATARSLGIGAMLLAGLPVTAGSAAHADSGSGSLRDRLVASGKINALGKSILRCYHPTGRFETASAFERWRSDHDFGAIDSTVLEIRFRGAFTGNQYALKTAVMARLSGNVPEIRAEILSDTAIIPANPHCAFREWINAAN